MRLRAFLSLLLLVGGAVPALAQQVRNPADLVPASALFYAELRQPGVCVRELAGLLEGSTLTQLPEALAKLQAKHGAGRMPEELQLLGLLLAPEMVKEAPRLHGAALAVTGIAADGSPEYVALVLSGESNAPGLLLRSFLMLHPSVRPIGTVEGVILYQDQHVGAVFQPVQPALPIFPARRLPPPPFPPPAEKNDQQPGAQEPAPAQVPVPAQRGFEVVAPAVPGQGAVWGEMAGRTAGPAFALLPGTILAGAPDAVGQVVRRLKGKAAGQALSGKESFQAAAQEIGDKPGLLLYGDLSALGAQLEKARPGPNHTPLTALGTRLVNLRALGILTGICSVENGNLNARLQVRLSAADKSPLLEALATGTVQPELLHYVPANALLALALAPEDGQKHWERFLDLADHLVKAADANVRLPSRQIDRLEDAAGVKIGKDIAAKVTQAVLVVGDPTKSKNDRPPAGLPPVAVVLQMADEDAAKGLVNEVVPRLFRAFADDRNAAPTVKAFDEQTVHALASRKAGALYYGRHGTTVVLGVQQAAVVDGLLGGTKKSGLRADAKIGAALKDAESSAALLVATRGLPGLLGLGHLLQPPAAVGVGPLAMFPQANLAPAGGIPGFPAVPPAPVAEAEEAESVGQELLKLAAGAGPLVLNVTRKPDRLLVEIRQTALKPALAKVVDRLVEAAFQSPARGTFPGIAQPFGQPGVPGQGAQFHGAPALEAPIPIRIVPVPPADPAKPPAEKPKE